MYSAFLKERMDKGKTALRTATPSEPIQKPKAKAKPKPKGKQTRRQSKAGRKRLRVDDDDDDDDDSDEETDTKRAKLDEEVPAEGPPKFKQPDLITGATLKDYQLDGVEWMVSLDQNGASGILADEMGLGKTLQTIAFSAYLRQTGHSRPFLVVCPLSVLHNWIEEYEKFAPKIPVCMYHGTPAERAELRRTVMGLDESQGKGDENSSSSKKANPKTKKSPRKKSGPVKKTPPQTNVRRSVRKSGRFNQISDDEDDEEEEEEEESEDESDDDYKDEENSNNRDADTEDDIPMADGTTSPTSAPTAPPSSDESKNERDMSTFPVVITTYEMIIRDRIHLAHYDWGYIVVDEGHRLKNLDCKLMQEIKKYPSAGRMILTGTPLHNNLAELWSLLNFILPDIFEDLDAFQDWFNLGTMQTHLSSERSSHIIHSLHAILKPFLLRRLKVDVETSLPPKKEYVLYAPLSERQSDVYDQVIKGDLRSFLMGKGKADNNKEKKKQIDVNAPRKSRYNGKERKRYDVDGDDDEYFDRLERGDLDERRRKEKEDVEEIGREHQYKATCESFFAFRSIILFAHVWLSFSVKQVNNMKLQNTVMQLRKVCSHPFLFDWPLDPHTHQPILNEDLVNASGKMMVLDRLLCELFRRKHKVLLFSQFTTMLDIIQDWACEFKGWRICRIDGSTPPLERREQMNEFQHGGDAPDAPILFLLSTRAGGLGITLTAADTVIFYDQDWNPQVDVQAQDRAHRIGQTKPVLIFRLVSAHTIETKIMQKATEKRKLEALVIAKGKFKMPASKASRGKPETMAEIAASLLKLEGEKIHVVPNNEAGKASVLSDEDLELLLDRKPEVFADRGQGWTSGKAAEGGKEVDGKAKAAFAVFDAPVDEGNDALAKLLGEDME
ncbi:hypothetical protein PILCRDRAFT_268568 [Piloderma croceum F 1598]|uniref:Helicase ATP-binding domain-containing protein n=1 Tax=Piloderma croceum (strain F 1598) TaxID=765440 RepID=A0A0C3CE68_PILCF|nr:hypothetical protein PILCRDRAFT_268568 [Piloderma croceum F 1598]